MTRANPRPRRSAVLVLVLLAVVSLAAPAAAAPVADAVVLAVSEEPLGPDPAPRDAEDNAARELGGYEDREVPFTWGAAWILTFLGVGGLALMLTVYYRSVARPGRDGARSA